MLRMPYNAIQFYLPDILGMSSVEITVNIPITTLQHQIHTFASPSLCLFPKSACEVHLQQKKRTIKTRVGRGMEKGVDFIIPFTIPHNEGNKPIHRSGNGNGASIPFHSFNCPDDDPFWKLKNLKTCRTVPDINAVQSERLNTFNSAFIPEYLVKMTQVALVIRDIIWPTLGAVSQLEALRSVPFTNIGWWKGMSDSWLLWLS